MNAAVEKVCARCGGLFRVAADYQWQKLCHRCYRGESAIQVHLRELKAENQLLRAELSQLRLTGPSQLDPRRWRQLLQLCHPDRHGGSAAANDATKWLLQIRAEVEKT